MTTLHDVIHTLIRGGHTFSDEENQRRAHLAVDAHAAGYPDAESYQAELDKQAAAARRESGAPETAEDRAARLEAENEQLRATLNAHAGTPAQPTTTSAP